MKELLELARAKREAARIFLLVGREMLRGSDQERLIQQSDNLKRSAAELESRAANLPDGD